jgi:flavin-dependent dehydrogenase
MESRSVVVIGAGPSGAVASALLKRRGHDVVVLERQQFPRFSIGESLLSHCLDFLEEAGMLDAVQEAGFQFKNGAAFAWGDKRAEFDFGQKFTNGKDSAFQVQRGRFDKLLADEASKQGVEIRYGVDVVDVQTDDDGATLTTLDEDGNSGQIRAKFMLDASGFGRVLPRLLELDSPSAFPVRHAVFTHIEDRIDDPSFDRNKILITVHPERRDVWYWLIPFADGRASIGAVAVKEYFESDPPDAEVRLRRLVAEDPGLSKLLANAVWDTPAREIGGYSANVRAMHGPTFALLGNAAEFLDPVFSSGVTIAMRSSSLAASVLDRQLRGEAVDWEADFAKPLKQGVDTFRAYVNAWYDGRFQDVIFHTNEQSDVRRMICSILAGYAWDQKNPYVAEPQRRLNVLVELCAPN